MLRQIFIIISLCLISYSAVASEDTTSQEKKKEYYQSPLEFALDVQYYAPSYKKYVYDKSSTTSAEGLTSEIGKGAQVSFEWLPFGNKIGKFGIGVGTGFSMIDTASITVDTTTRSVSLFVIPTQAFLSYRLDFFQNQIIVPFAKIGGSASWLRQTLDGGTSDKMAYGLDYSVGGELCLNAIESRAGRELDARFGVNGTYLIFEYLKSQKLSETNLVNLAYDAFRFGMRFEF